MFFAATLIGLRRELQSVRAFGTDGETALADAFAHVFSSAVRLTCFTHVQRNIKDNLHARHFPQVCAKQILDDVFGSLTGDVFSEGLVDCHSEDEVQRQLRALESRWMTIERSDPRIQPGFFSWFCNHKVGIITSTMLRPVREQAGLGCPPGSFTTNASETVNSMLNPIAGIGAFQHRALH